MTRSEEQSIIQDILGGNADLFETLVLENQNTVYALALKMTASEQDALDISQEAFIKAYTSLASFRGDSKFSVWLYRLTYNLCLDFLRKKKKAPTTSVTYINKEDEAEEFDIPDTAPLPEEQLERCEVQKAIADAIETLPPMQKEIFIMRESADMSYEDISQSLHISVGTVKSRLSRARQKIAQHLIKSGTFDDPKRHKIRKEE